MTRPETPPVGGAPTNAAALAHHRFWRSIDEAEAAAGAAVTPERASAVQAVLAASLLNRRDFMKLMGASLALAGVGAGVSGCDYHNTPPEKILPYVRQPENLVQGKPLYYASAVSLGGVGTGVVVESHMGRPTMIEGNEKHPDSLGTIDALSQASILGLYDPDRSQVVTRGRAISTFDSFLLAAVSALDAQRPKKGAGLRILTGTVTSPSLARLIRVLLKDFPAATWHQYEPLAPHSAAAGEAIIERKMNRTLAPPALAADGAGPASPRWPSSTSVWPHTS
jgi:molybdopterin-containing oxidoreductase family iron-sulfur binding subunit